MFSFALQLGTCYFSKFSYCHVPLRTILRFLTHKFMALKLNKKSDLTGACEFLNNFDLKILKKGKKQSISDTNPVDLRLI